MIIVDYSNVSCAAITMAVKIQKEECTEEFCKHMILNSMRKYTSSFRPDYGKLVLAVDSRINWRKGKYPEYKGTRKAGRAESDIDWDMVFSVMDQMKNAIINHFRWDVVEVEGAEADDIIGTLVRNTEEKTLIVSNDKDFFQLHNQMVDQYRPCEGKVINHPDPSGYLFEHIMLGDKGDGVPNVYSGDRVLVDDKSKPLMMSPKRKQYIRDNFTIAGPKENDVHMDLERNWARNKKMVDLRETPETLQKEIIYTYETSKPSGNQASIMKWLAENRMRILLSKIKDFM